MNHAPRRDVSITQPSPKHITSIEESDRRKMESSSAGVPPGFRFHPTDEELLHYYLKKKVSFQKFDLEVIREVDLNKLEPWDLQERCRIGSAPQNEWYFFSHKDRKYPTGSRTNRATNVGFWKATGRDKCIRNTCKKIGMRKTLVFYRGRAPHGQKTDWIMHEYRLEETDDSQGNANEEGWVVCRVFKKKNLFKVGNEGSTGLGPERQINGHDQPRSLTINNHLHFPRRHHSNHDDLQTFHVFKPELPELGLNYPQLPENPYQHLQAQVQAHKPVGYDFSTALPNDSPAMVKQFLSSHNDAGLARPVQYQACEPGQHMVEGNDWAMFDRLVNTHMAQEEDSSKGVVGFADENPSVQQMNPVPLRGEMDLWGYGK